MPALPIVLGGLAALAGGSKLLWNNYIKNSSATPYDIIIRIDSLGALQTTGWEILVAESTKNVEPQMPTFDESFGVVVSVLGSYNRGKSFLLNKLCNINLPSSNLIHTEGISITAGRNRAENIVFIDTAGADTAILKDKLDDKKATEALLREIALHLCSHIIIVVNRLRATDQSYIQQVLRNSKGPDCNKSIIIIHNLMDVETVADVDKIIKIEVEALFVAKPAKLKLQINNNVASIKLYRSTQNGMNLYHFIFTKDGFEAAKIWNTQSIDGIMSLLQTAARRSEKLDVVNETINYINTKLPQLFVNNQTQNNSSDESQQQRIQVQIHVDQPRIVLSHRKGMKNLEEDPYQLTLSPKLIYDDAGYFIGISSMDNGQWQPLYNLYETNEEIHAIIEPAGFKKGTAVQITEDAIIIAGRRDDFKELLTSPTVHHEKIPTGQFKLEIALKCKIDPEKSQLERVDGFYKIKCPKKKSAVTVLD